MLNVMWISPVRGTLRKANGKQISAKGLAKIINAELPEVRRGWRQLKREGVFSTLDDGTVYCRRVYRRWQLSRVRAAAGKKGGLKAKGKQNRPPSTSSSPSSSLEEGEKKEGTGSPPPPLRGRAGGAAVPVQKEAWTPAAEGGYKVFKEAAKKALVGEESK